MTMHKYPFYGKIPHSELKRIVFKFLGVPSRKIILGPKIGEDAAILNIGSKDVIISTDPITGAIKNIGWLSVHINANDVASYGVKPRWYLCSILLPESINRKIIREIMSEIDMACKELGISVIGGHSEVTPNLNRPIVIGTMIGETKKKNYVTSSGAKPGDKIILTKSVGLEGSAILATDFYKVLKRRIDDKILKKAGKFMQKISIVKDALTAMKVGDISAMHDPTEGGLLSGLWEIAEASKVGLRIFEANIPIAKETRELCNELGIDYFGLMSSGALLICCKAKITNRILSKLRKEGIPASIIGDITKIKEGRYISKTGSIKDKIKPPIQDELYKAIGDLLHER